MLAGAKAVASLVSANVALEELVLSANRLGCTWDSAKNEFVNNPSGVIPLPPQRWLSACLGPLATAAVDACLFEAKHRRKNRSRVRLGADSAQHKIRS
jgi:hypothetical protein